MSEDNVKIENEKVNENASEKVSEDSGNASGNTGKTKKKKTELDLLISQLKKNFNNKATLDEDDYSKALKILEFNKTKNKINKMLNEIEKATKNKKPIKIKCINNDDNTLTIGKILILNTTFFTK